MKLRFALIIIVCVCCLICSCDNVSVIESSSSSISVSNACNESISVNDYSVFPVSSSISFDGIIDVWGAYWDIDIESYDGTDAEGRMEDINISYQTDFQSVLSDMRRSDQLLEEMFGPSYISDPWCFLRGTETDYHITRFLKIDGLRVYEYDDPEWAESAYREAVDRVGINYNETTDSSLNQGYCFVYDYQIDHSRFFATYLFNDCIISYSCSVSDDERYNLYCSLCNELNLPTSGVGTELIHAHSHEDC